MIRKKEVISGMSLYSFWHLTAGHVHHKVAVFPVLGLLHNFVCYTFYISLLPLILFSEKFRYLLDLVQKTPCCYVFSLSRYFSANLGQVFVIKRHILLCYIKNYSIIKSFGEIIEFCNLVHI